MYKKFSIVIATDSKNGIWKNNSLAWKLSKDMKYFRELTTKNTDLWKLNAVIMWKKTWESIPANFKPLPNRINCILSRKIINESKNSKIDDFVLYFNSLVSCLSEIETKTNLDHIFIIGWADLYNQVLINPLLEKIYITKVLWDFDCDVFFDWVPNNFYMIEQSEEMEENWVKFRFEVYRKVGLL
jgi:dihydrofolate reductase